MEKQRDSKIMALVALVVAVIGTTVAFAALTSQLTIGGTSNVTVDARWGVIFQNLTTSYTGQAAFAAPAPAIDGTSTQISDYTATFAAPGDSITLEFDVVNTGTINAKLTGITGGNTGALVCTKDAAGVDADEDLVCDHLTYTLTTNGNAVAIDDALNHGTTTHMVLTLSYWGANANTATPLDLPSKPVTVTGLGLTLVYGQA